MNHWKVIVVFTDSTSKFYHDVVASDHWMAEAWAKDLASKDENKGKEVLWSEATCMDCEEE